MGSSGRGRRGGPPDADPDEPPGELRAALALDRVAAEAFAALTPAHRRSWSLFVASGRTPQQRADRARNVVQMLGILLRRRQRRGG